MSETQQKVCIPILGSHLVYVNDINITNSMHSLFDTIQFVNTKFCYESICKKLLNWTTFLEII